LEKYKIEERLPCALPELTQDRIRLPFANHDAPVGPLGMVRLLPAIRGGLVTTSHDTFLIEDSNLLRRLAAGPLAPRTLDEADLCELEQYHAAGFVSTGAEGGTVSIFDPPAEYTELYEADKCTWFTLAPEKIELDLTQRCNQNCVHCSRKSSSKVDTTRELSAERLFSIIQEAGAAGVRSLSLMGGEPTLHPYFIELAYFARHEGIPEVIVSTNGTTVDDKKAKLMAGLFSSVQVSIHGATAQTHNAVVGLDGAFNKACRAVELLAGHNAHHLTIAYTVMEANQHEVEAAVEMAEKLGAHGIRFLNLIADGRGKSLSQLDGRCKQSICEVIERRDKASVIPVNHSGFSNDAEPDEQAALFGCSAGRTILYSQANGRVKACFLLEEIVGDLSFGSLLEVWHGPALRRLRQRLDCDCPYSPNCMGACLVNENWNARYPALVEPKAY
jgi:radical SAM protein with 4Fe4S-binding SPASM domain